LAYRKHTAQSRILWFCIVIGLLGLCAFWSIRGYARLGEQLSSLGGIALGNTRGEIRYLLGVPPVVYGDEEPGQTVVRLYYTDPQKDPLNAMPEGSDINSYHTWSYNNGSGLDPHLDLTFDAKSGRIIRIDCVDKSEEPTGYCARLAGAGIGDPESRIVWLFGDPTHEAIDEKSGVKTMDYSDIGLLFLLTRQRVYSISVLGTESPKQVPFNRFLAWLSGELKADLRF
jgi:hypothetical protein